MKRKLNRLLIATTLFAPMGAFALGLGQIQIRSALNQPLNAEIEINTLGSYEPEQLSAQLASAQAFTQSGLDRPAFLSDLTFALQTRPDGTNFIKVTSRRPIREPIINFLMELEWPKGRLVREFAVFLDPPAAVTNLSPRSVPTVSTTPSPSAAQTPSSPTEPPAQQPSSTSLRTDVPQGTDTYTVPYGDTLWGIAQRYRPHSSISVQRMMEALYQANPGAFSRQSVDSLLAGAVLRIPSAQEIDPSIDPALATRPTPPVQPASVEPAQTQIAPTEPQPQVRLVPPEEDPAGIAVAPPPVVASAPVPAAPVDPGLAIKIDQGRLKLKVAGLDDIRNRVSALAQVDSSALAAIQQNEQPAVSEETAPEPITSETPAPVETIEPAEPAEPAESIEPAVPETPPTTEFQEVTPEPLQPPETQIAESATEQPEPVTTTGEEPLTTTPEAETPAPEPVAETETPAEPIPQTDPAPTEPVAEQSEPEGGLSALLRQPLFKNPTAWALIGFVLLLLIALPVMFLRRKKTDEDKDDETLFEDQPVPTKLAVSDEPEPVTTAMGDTIVKKPAPAQAAPKSATNPLERIDLLMAAGNYPEAENTAQLALREKPNDTALAAKMLDIHFATKNREKFLAGAQTLHDSLNNKTDPRWAHVVQLGRTLVPDHPLFGGTAQTQPATIPNTPPEPAKPKQEKPDDNPFGALDFEAIDHSKDAEPQTKPATSNDILGDLDGLDWQLPDVEPPTETTNLADEAPKEESLSQFVVPETPTPQSDFEDQLKNLNFDFEPTTQSPPGKEEDSPLTQFPDLDFALDGGSAPPAEQVEDKDDRPISAMSASAEDYVETKLDLATAYLEMGDPVGARTLLEEVLQEGNVKQKERAEEFMAKLP
ncbi:MAG: FimV/HubP family polar landmark protein [Candidatus Competibacteraceae bacterium]|jgi:pilus assembly protein FimV|nr:FimV/HubP family polar landmark protein [Candidatus Competibacteraceae bacterium]